jgi:hypothetical protein
MPHFNLANPAGSLQGAPAIPTLTAEELADTQDAVHKYEITVGALDGPLTDQQTAMTVSDLARLYLRLGRVRDAVAQWTRAAHYYESIGHSLKAAAVWKIVSLWDPHHPDACERIAANLKHRHL